jgi:hypothetical protein
MVPSEGPAASTAIIAINIYISVRYAHRRRIVALGRPAVVTKVPRIAARFAANHGRSKGLFLLTECLTTDKLPLSVCVLVKSVCFGVNWIETCADHWRSPGVVGANMQRASLRSEERAENMGSTLKKSRRLIGSAVVAALALGGISSRAQAFQYYFFSWSNANADSPPVNIAAEPVLNDQNYVQVANQLAVSQSPARCSLAATQSPRS